MIWLLFSISTAIFLALRDYQVKKYVSTMDPLTLSWSLYLFSIPIMIISIFYYGIPDFAGYCVKAILLGAGCDALASVLYVQSLKRGDLSKAIPMMSFIPVFQLISAPFVLAEFPSIIGAIGVIIVVSGAYLSNISEKTGGFWGPIRSLIKDRSCQLMLGVSLLWSISAMYHKIGVRSYPPYFWVFMGTIFNTIVLYPFIHFFSGSPWMTVIKHSKKLIIPSVYHVITLTSLYAALALAQVAYVSSIRRLNVLISIIFGVIIFKEGNLKIKLIGGSIMLAGAVIITLANSI